jgi:hypothetical protein
MIKHHLIISGTGRAGTTFLVQLFTVLGLDTGFSDLQSAMYENCDAGMEKDIHLPDAPYIIKTPWLCDYLDEVLEAGNRVIDHAIVPVRDLYSAAQSRRDVSSRTDPALYPAGIPGGLWHTNKPEQQEAVLTDELYKLIYTLARRDIPLTLLHFPKLIHDPDYLFRKLEFALPGIGKAEFLEAFQRVVKPELVHTFTAQPVAGALSGKPKP